MSISWWYRYDFKGMIDYIFFSRNLMRAVGLLGPLDAEWIKANRIVGFPHPHVPSDHLPLMVELELINSNSNYSVNNSFGNSSSSLSHFQLGNMNNGNRQLAHHSQQQYHSNSNNNNSYNSNNGSSMIGQMIPINSNSINNVSMSGVNSFLRK